MEEKEVATLEVVEKPYKFKEKFTTEDIFAMVAVLSKIGVNKLKDCFTNKEVQGIITKMQTDDISKDDLTVLGGGVFFVEVMQVVFEGLPRCKDDMYKLLASSSNLSVDQIKNLDGVVFLEMIEDFIKREGFANFMKAVSKYFNMAN